jgi:CO/xanthine dehydrogenase FAD-binding subunit
MRIAELALHEPASLAGAFQLLRELPSSRILAGGTDLLVDLKTGRTGAEHLVSLRHVPSLRGIERDGDSPAPVALRIGALTTIAQLERSPLLLGPHAIIREAASQMAALQVRNIATIGGNLASAVPCADLPPVLGVLDAVVMVASAAGVRRIPLRDFFAGPRQTQIQHGEIVTAVHVPAAAMRSGAAFARLALRDGNAIAVASVAVCLTLDDRGTIRDLRMMLGAVAPVPKAVTAAEKELIGAGLAEAQDLGPAIAMAAAEPISDLRASAGYRREVVGVLARRALGVAWNRAMEASS